MTDTPAPTPHVPFAEAARLWFKVGILSFGGAAAQIAMLHRLVVDERQWIDEATFVHLLNFCMLLPGPEAQQLATFIGWKLHGVRGGIVAGTAFVLPGAAVMLGLCFLYVLGSGFALVDGLFFGIKCAVLAIIVEALLRIARRALRTRVAYGIALVAFLALLLLHLPFPAVVIGAALAAIAAATLVPGSVGVAAATNRASGDTGSLAQTVRTIGIWIAIWFAPVALAALTLGPSHLIVEIGLFFSKLAMLTFGGAYALLAWLAQEAVEVRRWVTAPEMLDGLGLAETTPGPTILVNQFVGFLAGWRNPAPFPPAIGATLAAAMTVWVTFAPSFLWIFAGAPYVDAFRRSRVAAAALAGITAAVVGVIAYLAFWFGLRVLFASTGEATFGIISAPVVDVSSLRWPAALLTVLAFLLLLVWHRGLAVTLAATAAAGVALRMARLV